MKATIPLVAVMTTLSVACGANSTKGRPTGTSPSPMASASSPVASPTGTPVAGLVGRWQRVVTCHGFVSELKQAGLGPLARYAWLGQGSSTGQSSFAPGSPKPTQAHPCTGALARVHSHFFTRHGRFGSLDWLGGQVDDGSYRIINGNTFRIGSVAFRYRILHGDTLRLAPVLTKAMIRQSLADPQKFGAAGWAVSVAQAGHTWMRIPCEGWC
jgi:hypothetical protein